MNPPAPLLRPASDVRFRILDGEAVVLCQNRAEVLGLSEVGGRILELCDGSRTLGEVVDLLAAEFDGDRATIASDAERFVAELRGLGVLVPGD